jgi:uncharacterized protein
MPAVSKTGQGQKSEPLIIAGQAVALGETRDLQLEYSQSYTGIRVSIPVRVVRGSKPGPTVCLIAVVHGDELNGLGILRELVFERELKLEQGSVVVIPVANASGLEHHSRYMPDRRDLNRSFPGSPGGSQASRLAHLLFNRIIRHCDYGLDFHTAAVRRTNYPNVRGDLTNPDVAAMARAFGCELIVNNRGAEGSLRRTSVDRGIPMIILEAGEVWKMEPGVVELGVRGAENVLKMFRMLPGPIQSPSFQTEIHRTLWVRAEWGGILKFHVLPGEMVKEGQCLATNMSIFGVQQNRLISPADGIVLGMSTMPAVKPGEPVFHLAIPSDSMASLRRKNARRGPDSLHQRIQEELATNIQVSRQT